jgi:hypothetical protein
MPTLQLETGETRSLELLSRMRAGVEHLRYWWPLPELPERMDGDRVSEVRPVVAPSSVVRGGAGLMGPSSAAGPGPSATDPAA